MVLLFIPLLKLDHIGSFFDATNIFGVEARFYIEEVKYSEFSEDEGRPFLSIKQLTESPTVFRVIHNVLMKPHGCQVQLCLGKSCGLVSELHHTDHRLSMLFYIYIKRLVNFALSYGICTLT